ncbi:hypothetical protein DERP_005395 [Dermatophagoides pteronyssinus]|uniref:Uncharacterized protein n=1 Tax=Dermatophagoides pteronyssinus TaxID=6956 RepID=A0ABQ8JN19_DERPT|nr:hypothetical protein DERP_005395 [Dermatophagoides pteronyssinus]
MIKHIYAVRRRSAIGHCAIDNFSKYDQTVDRTNGSTLSVGSSNNNNGGISKLILSRIFSYENDSIRIAHLVGIPIISKHSSFGTVINVCIFRQNGA